MLIITDFLFFCRCKVTADFTERLVFFGHIYTEDCFQMFDNLVPIVENVQVFFHMTTGNLPERLDDPCSPIFTIDTMFYESKNEKSNKAN